MHERIYCIASLVLIGVGTSLSQSAGAQVETLVSPFNGIEVGIEDGRASYSLLMGGHLYGSPHTNSGYPASSLLGNIRLINGVGAKFFVALGDNFRKTEPGQIGKFKTSLIAKLKLPFFNAVGNHDVTDRQLYQENFGKTYFHFQYKRAFYLFLDTELSGGRIIGAQFDFFKNALEQARANGQIQTVFIFSHRLIWSIGREEYRIVFEHLNSQEGYPDGDNFKNEIEPVLVNLAQRKTLYWVSGDIGASWSLPIFYHTDKTKGITYIATGIGDTAKDALIQADIDSLGKVKFLPLSLTGYEFQPIETYGLAYWKDAFPDKSKKKNIKKKTPLLGRMLRHRFFWVGLMLGGVIIGLGAMAFLLYRKRI